VAPTVKSDEYVKNEEITVNLLAFTPTLHNFIKKNEFVAWKSFF
jgi:hypothetical protein